MSTYEVLYPLFNFQYSGEIEIEKLLKLEYDPIPEIEKYTFRDDHFILRSFDIYLDYPVSDVDFFSSFEKRQMENCKWCISIKENETEAQENSRYLSLLLIAFRIRFNCNCYVKYKICVQHPHREMKLHSQFSIIQNVGEIKEEFNKNDIIIIDNDFKDLIKLFEISFRPRHAIEFFYLGFTEYYALAAFVQFMTSLECFFLPYTRVEIKQTLKNRIPKFIDDNTIVTENLIEELYILRSNIAHGKIKTDLELTEFLPKLNQLKNILLATIRKIIDQNLMDHFYTEELKENFFNTL